MPRSPYSYNIAGNVHREAPDGSNPSDVLTTAISVSEAFSGVSRRKPVGFLPPTPYNFLYRQVFYANGECRNTHVSNPALGQVYTGTVGGAPGGRFNSNDHFNAALSENHSVPGLANRALIKARVAMKRSSVNLGIAFAERNRTARLVGDTASRLGRSYRALRRGEVRNAMDILGITSARGEPRGNNAPQKWLELQYGWKPLLSDVYGSVDALNKRARRDWIVTAKGRSSASGTNSVEFGSFGAGRMTARWNHRCFCRIDVLPLNDAIMSLASLGITNPLLIGWELVPFSFVVDWFLPIGSWLESLDATLGFTVAGFSLSTFSEMEWDGVGRTLPPAAGFTISNSYTESKRLRRLVRTTSSSVPLPLPPGLKDPRSLEHMANGLSLLASAFGRR